MNNIKNIIGIALVCSSLSACGIYSKFEAPDQTDVTDSLYDYIEASSDTTNIASIAWRELFTDPYLQDLIEQALENNTDLNVARLSVEQAKAALSTARLAFLPSLNLTPSASISSSNGQTSQSYNLAASASWTIDVFGKLRNAKQQNIAALEQSTAYRQAVQTELIATVANSYYSLLMLDEQLDLSRRTLANWQKNLEVTEALNKAGKVNTNSVLQTRASVVSLNSSVVSLEEQVAGMENSISTLLALVPQSIERGSIKDASFPDELAVGVPMQLLSNRPDVRVAEAALAEAFYATNEARSAMYPSITLSGSAGYTNGSGSFSDPGDMVYSAVASLVQPIFNAGSLRADLNISKAQQEQALLQFKQALLDAGSEVNTALIQWQSAKERLVFDAEQMALLEKAVSGSELLMKHGSVNYLEVLTSQISLLQAELTYANDKFSEIQGVIYLYQALGGGAE